MIATLLRMQEDRRRVEAVGARRFRRVAHFNSFEDIVESMLSNAEVRYVIDLEVLDKEQVDNLERVCSTLMRPPTINVVHDLSDRGILTLARCAQLPLQLNNIFLPYHNLDENHLLNAAESTSASVSIIREFTVLLSKIDPWFIRFLVLSETGPNESQAARYIGVSSATARHHARRLGFRSFSHLRRLGRAAHASYRLERLGWPSAEVARASGWEGSTKTMWMFLDRIAYECGVSRRKGLLTAIRSELRECINR